jgi:hypothetical protein
MSSHAKALAIASSAPPRAAASGLSSASGHDGRGNPDGGGDALAPIYRGSSSVGGALGPDVGAAARTSAVGAI